MADLIEREPLLASMFPCAAKRQVEEAPAVNRWIPCSERFPEEDVSVLCYMQIGEIVVMQYGGDGWYCGVIRYNPRYVTHWMPLPEPPESEVNHDE